MFSSSDIGVAGRASGQVVADGVQGGVLGNTAAEETFFSLTVPGQTFRIADLVAAKFFYEVTAFAVGTATFRIRLNTVEVASAVEGAAGVGSIVLPDLTVIDTGLGLQAARIVVVGGTDQVIDLRENTIWDFSGQWSAANVGNAFRGLQAFMGV